MRAANGCAPAWWPLIREVSGGMHLHALLLAAEYGPGRIAFKLTIGRAGAHRRRRPPHPDAAMTSSRSGSYSSDGTDLRDLESRRKAWASPHLRAIAPGYQATPSCCPISERFVPVTVLEGRQAGLRRSWAREVIDWQGHTVCGSRASARSCSASFAVRGGSGFSLARLPWSFSLSKSFRFHAGSGATK